MRPVGVAPQVIIGVIGWLTWPARLLSPQPPLCSSAKLRSFPLPLIQLSGARLRLARDNEEENNDDDDDYWKLEVMMKVLVMEDCGGFGGELKWIVVVRGG